MEVRVITSKRAVRPGTRTEALRRTSPFASEVTMQLDIVYARFFRSLNHDYIRKSAPGYAPDPWDSTPSGASYPFVKIRLEPGITTIVGGNESGKSQMLATMEAALTGNGIKRSDFCRYSPFFSVDKELLTPEFGALFRDVTAADVELIEDMCSAKDLHVVERVALFRDEQHAKTTPVYQAIR